MKNYYLSFCILIIFSPFLTAQPTFTGNAGTDFASCGCTLNVDYPDPVGDNGDVCISPGPGVPQTGFDVQHIYMHYDQANDRLYIGMDMVGIAGDADGDGDPQTNTLCSQVDCPGCGAAIQQNEIIGINLDVNQDGKYDYFVGWALGRTTVDFFSYKSPRVNAYPGLFAMDVSSAVTLITFVDPPNAGAPDPEFILEGYSNIDPDIQMGFSIFTDTPVGGEDLGGLSNVSFPVVLTALDAVYAEDQIQVSWQTARETNNQGFEIQLAGADKNFLSQDFVPGQGTTEGVTDYDAVLSQFFAGKNYLRLKQIDLDGQVSYSRIVELDVDRGTLVLYPTETDGELFVSYPHESDLSYSIVSLDGKELRKGTLSTGTHTLDLHSLARGMYVFKGQSREGRYLVRFVKK